jgi:hypothetical protein
MAFEIFVSPSVITREIDASFVPAGVASIVGTAIGLTQKGPAFTPVRILNYDEFSARFGGLNPNYYTNYAVRSYLRNASSVYTIRILGKSTVTLGKAVQIAFPASGTTQSITAIGPSANTSNVVFAVLRSRVSSPANLSYSGNYSNCVISSGTESVTVSFDSTSENYIRKVLGTNSTTAYSGDSLTAWYVDSVFDFATALTAGQGSISGSLTAANAVEVTNYKTISGGYSHGGTPYIVSQNFSGRVYPLFKVHALSDGDASNYDVKITITNVQTVDSSGRPLEFPKFDLLVRDLADTDRRPVIYETFSGLSLDPTSKNFIAKQIGDKYQTVDLTQDPPEIVDNGNYDQKSRFIRVEVFEGYPNTARPSGFQGFPKGASPKLIPAMPYKTNHLDSNGEVNSNQTMGVDFLNYSAKGINDRIKSSVTQIDAGGSYTAASDAGLLLFATTAETTSSSSSLSSTYTFVDISSTGSNYQQRIRLSLPLYGGFNGYSQESTAKTLQVDGSLTAAYLDAAKIISNTRLFDTNLVVTPGINSSTPGNIADRILQVVEERGDCFYILDLAANNGVDNGLDTTIQQAVDEAANYDSSYAASYYPWLQIYDSENDRLVWVPPSVEVFGAYAYNDRVAQPWSAPAGFTRAALNNVRSVRKRITTSHSDTLYAGKVNPIVKFANEGIVIFGQKTLQTAASSLDRVNVRRLMLEIRKVVASMAKFVTFEPNDPQTRQNLTAVIKPYLERVQQLRGIEEFRIIFDDTTTTADLVERNTIYGKIHIKPTKTAEFILVDFILSRQGASFSE